MFNPFLSQISGKLTTGILSSIVRTENLDLLSTRALNLGFPLSKSLKYFTLILYNIDPYMPGIIIKKRDKIPPSDRVPIFPHTSLCISSSG